MRWFKQAKYLIIPLVILGIFEVMNSRDIISGESNVPEYGLEEFRAGVPLPEQYKSFCEMWKDEYPTVPNLSSDYVMQKGQIRILELGPNELSRKITAKGAAKFDSSNEVVVLLPDGESVTHHPTDNIDLKGYSVLQFVFENEEGGCIILKS